MASSKVPTVDAGEVIVQGFRAGPVAGAEPYVFIGVLDPEGALAEGEIQLSVEDANILAEEIRKHAEFAANAASKGE